MTRSNSRQADQLVIHNKRTGTPSMNPDTEHHRSDAPESQTDLQLVRKVRHGDRSAFDLLVVKYQSRVASIISRYVYDSQEVLDLTQETFVKAFRAIDRFRGDSAFYTWLYRIAVNTAKNFLSQAPWMAIWPGAGIFLVVMGFNLMGDGLRDALDPREH